MPDYTDPPGMPDDERMTRAELKVTREYLGLSTEALGVYLEVAGRTVRHWEDGRYPIPDGARLEIEALEQHTVEAVGRIIDELMDLPDPTLTTYATDADYQTAHPDQKLTAQWHRAVCARVAQEVPGLSITY
jgi:hypothetical protein